MEQLFWFGVFVGMIVGIVVETINTYYIIIKPLVRSVERSEK